MITLESIKIWAKFLDRYDIQQGKEYAHNRRLYGMWWIYECVEMYQFFLVYTNKLFWWSMVVKTLRFANHYVRKESELK